MTATPAALAGKVSAIGPSLVEYGDYRFVIFDSPSDDNIVARIQVLF